MAGAESVNGWRKLAAYRRQWRLAAREAAAMAIQRINGAAAGIGFNGDIGNLSKKRKLSVIGWRRMSSEEMCFKSRYEEALK